MKTLVFCLLLIYGTVEIYSDTVGTEFAKYFYDLAVVNCQNASLYRSDMKLAKPLRQVHLIRIPKASSTSLSVVSRRVVGCQPPGPCCRSNSKQYNDCSYIFVTPKQCVFICTLWIYGHYILPIQSLIYSIILPKAVLLFCTRIRWPGDPIGSCPSKRLFACQTQQRVIGCTHHQSFYNALIDRRIYSISIIRHPYRRSVSAFFYPGIHHNEECTKAQRGKHECFLEYTTDPR